MSTNFKYGLALLVAGTFITAQPVSATSLKQAIAYGVKHNPRVTAAQASRRATNAVLGQARARYLPEVALNADVGKQKIDRPEGFGPLVNDQTRTRRQVTLSVRQVLFDGFDRANQIYSSQARISAAAEKVMARSEAVALTIVEAYIDVVRHQALLRLAKENVARHRRLLRIVKERAAGGKTSDGDLQQTNERLQAAIALVSQIKIALGTSKAKYKSSVGKAPSRLHAVRMARNLPRSPRSAMRLALDHHPRLRAMRAEIDVADFDVEQFKSSLYPQVYLEGNASRGFDLDGTPGKSDELKGMIVLNWKLYDGGARTNRIEELNERASVKIAEYDVAVRELQEQIDIAWVRYREGGNQVAAVRKQLNQNKRVLAAYEKEYEANKRSLLDVLDAESSRFASEFDLSNVGAIQKFSGYQLVATSGRLLSYFGVEAPEGSDVPSEDFRTPRTEPKSRKFVIPSLSGD